MSDRIAGMVVTFDKDVSEELAEHLRQAILSFKHVVDVQPLVAEPSVEFSYRARTYGRIQGKILDLLRDEFAR